MTSKLTSLLKYRFVKRDGKSESSENGSQSSENGSQSDTQPPSETSTQAPVTPDKKPGNLQITPGSKNTSSTEPLSSPDSPIFSTRPKLIDRNWGASPDKDSASSSSSPWLSKENGQIANGHSEANRKGARKYPSFSDGESDDDTSGIEDYDGKMERLKSVFPVKMESEIKQALIDKGGDLDGAIDVLIGSGKSKFKRIRKHSQESTSDPDTPTQPRKRIRKISSDSGDEDGVDSQATESYGLESQRSDATIVYEVEDDNSPLTDDQEKQIKFLKNCFKDKSRQELRRVLSQHDWCVADATVAMSAATTLKAVTSENKIRAKAAASVQETKDIELDDEDDDYGSGNESEGSDDSIEEEGDAGRNVILDFFADASLEELMATPGCSKKKSELIVSHRPFASWEDLVDKFVSVKGLSYDLISGCREVIKIRDTVIRLMQRCEKISSTMEQVVSNLIHSNTLVDDSNHITQQPSNLNPDMQLKPFQMVGLNWLRVMHSQELNGILADEMGLGKTVQTVAFLAHLLEEGHMGPHVIIVPSSTIDNWIREAKVWCPTMKVLVYYGSQEDRRATRQYIMYNNADNFNVIITTYNMATGSVEDRALFKKFEFHYAIFDEGHLLKNMSSLRYQNLMRVTAYRRLLLTGTPLQNNLLELMSLLCFVMPDMFVGKTEPLKRMFTTISRTGNDEKRSHYEQERIAHAKRIMKPFVLRRLKSEVMSQLPNKSERVQYCKMIPSQQELYDNLIHNFSVQMTASGMTASAAGAGAAMLMKLRKAANHPLLHRTHYSDKKIEEMAKKLCEEPSHKDRGALPKLISEDMQVMSDFELHKCCIYYKSYLGKYILKDSLIKDSGKFHLLDGLLDKHQALDHRVLLFSQFTTLLDIMELFLKQKHIKFIRLDGSTAVVERQKLIDQYNNDKSIFVFLLSTKAGGLGINLTSANVVILHDIDFNPYNDKQAEDRCHRVGQTREVQIVRLISQSTVEEAMLKCGQEKLKLEKDVISTDGTDSDTGNIKDVASILKQALHAQTVRLNS